MPHNLRHLLVPALLILILVSCAGPGSTDVSSEPALVPGLNGRVVTATGTPATGVTVDVFDATYAPTGALSTKQAVTSASTDSQGYFRISDVTIGLYNVLAVRVSEGDVAQNVEVADEGDGTPTRTSVGLELVALGSVEGQARFNDREDHGGILVYVPGTSFVAVTTSSGAFHLDRMPRGTYNVAASAASYGHAQATGVVVQPGAKTTMTGDLVLHKDMPIVEALDRSFAGIGETVEITGRNFGSTRGTNLVSFGSVDASNEDYVSWSDTRIQVRAPIAARSGAVVVRTSLGEGASSEALQILAVLEKVSGDGQLGKPSLDASESLLVRVLDTEGEPVSSVAITFTAPEGGSVDTPNAVTSLNGSAATRFEFGPDMGVYAVRAQAPYLQPVEFNLHATWYDSVSQTPMGWDVPAAAHVMEDGSVFLAQSSVLKTDATGTVEWRLDLEGTGRIYASDVTADSGGNVYVAGSIEGGSFPGFPEVQNGAAFLTKIGPAGDLEWLRQFSSDGSTHADVVDVQPDGSLFVGGFTFGAFPGFTNQGRNDVFIARFSSTGEMEWVAQAGTDSIDRSADIGVDGSGNAYLLGYTFGALPGYINAGGYDGLLLVVASGGTVQRVQQFGNENDNFPTKIIVEASGAAFVTDPDHMSSNDGRPAASVTRIRADGTLDWRREFADPGTYVHSAMLHEGTLLVVGSTDGALPGEVSSGDRDAFVVELDLEGNLLVARQYGTAGYDRALDVAVLSDGTFVTLGYTDGAFPGHDREGISGYRLTFGVLAP